MIVHFLEDVTMLYWHYFRKAFQTIVFCILVICVRALQVLSHVYVDLRGLNYKTFTCVLDEKTCVKV